MPRLEIVTIPDPILRRVAEPARAPDAALLRLMDAMLETMYEAPGVGLAAPQVGVSRRVIVMDTARENEPKTPLSMINPEIIWASEDRGEYEEGCLSIPEFYEMVTRPKSVRVRYADRKGEVRELACDGLLATVVQHEIDHLNGVLFIDYISRLKRERVIKKFAKAARAERERV